MALVAVLTIACGNVSRRQADLATPAPVRDVGRVLRGALPTDEAPTPDDDDGVKPGSGPASFVVRLTDDNSLHPAGIPVKMSGPVTRTLVSDAEGELEGSVAPGVYRFEVLEGCHESVLVTSGGSATVGIAAGETTRGNLGVFWQHRYGPSSPVVADRSGDWPVGEKVDVRFTVRDRCSDDGAPGKAFPTFVFEVSENLRLVSKPVLVAGGDGNAHVFVSCTSTGEITLDAVDRANPTDRLDLAALAIGFGGVPRCT